MNVPERSESINIRKAQVNDVEFVCELLFGLKSMYASCPETSLDAFSKHYMAAIEQALKSPTNSIWVAQTPGGEIVGFISMTRRLVLRLAGEVGVLEEIFVRQDYRRRGVGYKLWQYAIEELRKQRIKTVEVVSSLAHPGQRQFVQKIGLEWYSNIHRVQI